MRQALHTFFLTYRGRRFKHMTSFILKLGNGFLEFEFSTGNYWHIHTHEGDSRRPDPEVESELEKLGFRRMAAV